MEIILINYSHNGFRNSQKQNTKTGLIHGANRVINYGFNDLDPKFIEKNANILLNDKGAGYWLWKPYIILETLKKSNDNDVIFYSDSGVEFINSIHPLVDLCIQKTEGVLVFHMEPIPENKEVLQTKKDTFILMECDTPFYQDSWGRLSSFSLWKKNSFSIKIANEWLEYAQNPQIITDLPSQYGEEDSRFIAHRHDQSILSLLTKKYNITSYPDPSQWGNGYRNEVSYEQIINHTRNRQ